MSIEVAQILKTIENYASCQTSGTFLAETHLEKLLFAVALVALVLAIPLLFIEPLRVVGLVAGLVFLLAVVALTLVQVFSLVVTVRRPLAGYAKAAQARVEARSKYISDLATFPPDAILKAKLVLESDSGRMQRRLAVLVGAIEKIGFIPAGVTLYYAALQVPSEGLLPSNILLAFVFGLYGGALMGHRLIEALHQNAACLEEAYELARGQERSVPNNSLNPTDFSAGASNPSD